MFFEPRARSGARAARRAILGGAAMLLAFGPVAYAQTLSPDDALSRVAASDPTVAANAARLEAADAAILQAGVRPRDVVGVDFEDFAGTGPYSPLNRSQTTGWYERTWERPCPFGVRHELCSRYRVKLAGPDVKRRRRKVICAGGDGARVEYRRVGLKLSSTIKEWHLQETI